MYNQDASGIYIRPEFASADYQVITEVIHGDSYHVKDIESAQYILDIGAHIGCFAHAIHNKFPEAEIACVEVCPENWGILNYNAKSYATVFEAACTYSKDELYLANTVSAGGQTTGGSIVGAVDSFCNLTEFYKLDERPIKKITIEQIMNYLDFPRIDILKLDCEGSEFSILRNCTCLDRVRLIVGEYHGLGRWQNFLPKFLSSGDWEYGTYTPPVDQAVFYLRNKKANLSAG